MSTEKTEKLIYEGAESPGLAWRVLDSLFFVAIGVLVLWLGFTGAVVLYRVLTGGVPVGDEWVRLKLGLSYALGYSLLGYAGCLLAYLFYAGIGRVAHRPSPRPHWLRSGTHKMLVAFPIGMVIINAFTYYLSTLRG